MDANSEVAIRDASNEVVSWTPIVRRPSGMPVVRRPSGLPVCGSVNIWLRRPLRDFWVSSVLGQSIYMATKATQRLLGIQHVRSVNGPVLVIMVLPPYSLQEASRKVVAARKVDMQHLGGHSGTSGCLYKVFHQFYLFIFEHSIVPLFIFYT